MGSSAAAGGRESATCCGNPESWTSTRRSQKTDRSDGRGAPRDGGLQGFAPRPEGQGATRRLVVAMDGHGRPIDGLVILVVKLSTGSPL